MFKNIIALLVFALACNLGSAESDGVDFVFSYSAYALNKISKVASASVVVIPLGKDNTYCDFIYTKSSGQMKTIHTIPVFGKTNEYQFNFTEVVLLTQYDAYDFDEQIVKDFRIFAKCTAKVKLIGKISDQINAWGDMFLIPSSSNAAIQYVLAMPTSSFGEKGSVSFLPVASSGQITINITTFMTDTEYGRNRSYTYDMAIAQDQRYMSVMFNVFNNASLILTASSPIMITLTAPRVTSNSITTDYCGTTCLSDYVTFMPIGVNEKKCKFESNQPEENMITNDFTSRIYIYPTYQDGICNDKLTATVYDDITNLARGTTIDISLYGKSSVSLVNKKQTGVLTYDGPLRSYRQGAILESDGITAHGHFAHYLPMTKEWVEGNYQFFTLAKDCVLEFYVQGEPNTNSIDLNHIKIDGTPVTNMTFTTKVIELFDTNVSQYAVSIKGYGIHTFVNEGSGKSVGYVICKNVNSPSSGMGYLTGFNMAQV
uniref:IgGFc_binding domain-containing protein n=1 Tax=Rhabditophanes sp. KR3021 TaxID=114890 RepID=A0AC35TXW3_9BILA